MNRIILAFRCFFNLLFSGELSAETLTALNLAPRRESAPAKAAPSAAPPAAPPVRSSDGALQLLAILQRDSRLVDFLMEDISSYADDQVGAAVRAMHDDCRASLLRHVTLAPVIDGLEGTFQKLDASKAPDPNRIKLIGNVPANGKAPGGTLRHRGWLAASVNLPPLGKQDAAVLTPAEIEIE